LRPQGKGVVGVFGNIIRSDVPPHGMSRIRSVWQRKEAWQCISPRPLLSWHPSDRDCVATN